MKKEVNKLLIRKVTVRFTCDEFGKLNRSYKMTTKRKLSEYIRAVLLEKPVTVYTRNQSFDDFVAEMILLKNELRAIGNNLNQAVKKLHSMDRDGGLKTWALINENNKQLFLNKVDEINLKIAQIADKWLQE